MAFIRRGNVRAHHRLAATITLHRIDGFPVKCPLKAISCWEEQSIGLFDRVVSVYFTNLSSVAVRESFDAIDREINGKAVIS